jgi:site-specific DNA-methyltransferase (adenine-specific)
MEYMATQPDKAFDLAIVDPPYRNQEENQPTKDMRRNGPMRSFGDKPKAEYFKELCRVSREQIIWGANNFNFGSYKGFVVWEKETIGETFTMSMAEIASLSDGLGTTSKIYKIRPQDKFRVHPTQKPVKLYQWLLTNYAKPGQRILDTHLGSGSSAIAAHYFGVDFVGCEIDEDYYQAAKARIDQETRQIAML